MQSRDPSIPSAVVYGWNVYSYALVVVSDPRDLAGGDVEEGTRHRAKEQQPVQ